MSHSCWSDTTKVTTPTLVKLCGAMTFWSPFTTTSLVLHPRCTRQLIAAILLMRWQQYFSSSIVSGAVGDSLHNVLDLQDVFIECSATSSFCSSLDLDLENILMQLLCLNPVTLHEGGIEDPVSVAAISLLSSEAHTKLDKMARLVYSSCHIYCHMINNYA